MRNMSFAITTDQIRMRTKTVTRRMGWRFLKPGDMICAVEKGMGLKKGEKVNRLANLIVTSVNAQRLCDIDQEDVAREGFPDMSVQEFITMFCASHKGCKPDSVVTRIEFDYKLIFVPADKEFKFKGLCPYCKGDLTYQCNGWQMDENGLWMADTFDMSCSTSPDIDSKEWEDWINIHSYMPYVNQLPVDERVKASINKRYRFSLKNIQTL